MSNPLPSFIKKGATVIWRHTGSRVKVSDLSRVNDGEGWVGIASGNISYPITWLQTSWLVDPNAPVVRPPARARATNAPEPEQPPRTAEAAPIPTRARATLTRATVSC